MLGMSAQMDPLSALPVAKGKTIDEKLPVAKGKTIDEKHCLAPNVWIKGNCMGDPRGATNMNKKEKVDAAATAACVMRVSANKLLLDLIP